MIGRKLFLACLVSLGFCLLACGSSLAQDSGAKPKLPPKPEAVEAPGDDFRPMAPPGKFEGRGPRGAHEIGRGGGPGKPLPGGPAGGPPDGQPEGKQGFPPGAGGRGQGPFEQPGFSEGFGGMPHGPGGMAPMGMPGAMPGAMPGMPAMGMPLGPPRWPHGDWQSLEQNDPEMHKLLQADYALEKQSQELVLQYRQAPQDQRETLKQQLEKVVTEHFESRQQRRRLELKRLEEELQRLRESIDKRTEAQSQIVNRRVAELLGIQEEPQF